METIAYEELDGEDRELLDAAREVRETAYAPYSGVRVGAALRAATGIIAGSNVENAAYGSTICAERMAVGRANAGGDRSFEAVAVTAHGGTLAEDQVVSPCGACRQVLHEMAAITGTETRVIMDTPGGHRVAIATLAELLPFPFDPLSP